MGKINLNVTLTLQGPILTQSSSPGEFGIDAPMARTKDGKPYLPETLVIGRLRQSLNELSEATSGSFIKKEEIYDLLGPEPDKKKSGVEPERKRLQITDFMATSQGGNDTLYRIRMDKERGAVATGAYLVIDSPFAPGDKVSFMGTISYILPDGEKDTVRDKIEKGLLWTTSFGAQRTIGFGRLIDVKVVQENALSSEIECDTKGAYFRLVIRPDKPFCIAKRKVDENLFESEEIIPGGVIKGSLASTWGMLVKGKGPDAVINQDFDESRKALAENFNKIRFTHAFPVNKEQKKRPTVFPLSLVRYTVKSGNEEKTVLGDVARIDKPGLLGNPTAAPAFSIDWKRSRGDVFKRFGWPELSMELRVRTAMDRSTRASKEKHLFAYEMVVPDGHEWAAMIDLSRVTGDREKVITQLMDLLGYGMNNWGKTKCHAETAVTRMEAPVVEEPKDGLYIITLQTPAILCDPAGLSEASGQKELFGAYSAVWKELSDSSLELVRFFGRQSLAGGDYLHKRFQAGKDYYPWLLTDPGSVFVLKKTNGNAHGKITDWLKHGLNLPAWAKKRYEHNGFSGDDWRCCPYIPENGYGEIAVNIKLEDFPEAEEV
jgi:hypothetical protein